MAFLKALKTRQKKITKCIKHKTTFQSVINKFGMKSPPGFFTVNTALSVSARCGIGRQRSMWTFCTGSEQVPKLPAVARFFQ